MAKSKKAKQPSFVPQVEFSPKMTPKPKKGHKK